MLRFILEKAGYEVAEASHGAAALDDLTATPSDLVLTDLMMPVMGGGELIRRLRADPSLARLPVLVVTGNPEATEAVASADAVVGKPFLPADLLKVAGDLLARGSQWSG